MTSPGRSTTAKRAHDGARRRRAVPALLLAGALTLAGCAGTSQPGATGSGSAAATHVITGATATPTRSETTSSDTTSAPSTAVPSTITAPADGATVAAGQVTVTGTGTAFEGTLSWQVLAAETGNVITHGFTTAGANGAVGPFTFTVDLTPGRYTIEVWAPDMSDNATPPATRHGLATTTFTVS